MKPYHLLLQFEQVRTLYQNLETGLKSVRAGMAKLQQELNRAEAQRQQGQTPSGPLPLNPQAQSMSLPSPLYLNRPGAVAALGAGPTSAATPAVVPTMTHVPAAAATSAAPSGLALQPNGATAQVGQCTAATSAGMLNPNAQLAGATAPFLQPNQAAEAQQGTAATALQDQPQIKAEPAPAAVVKAELGTAEVPASSIVTLPGATPLQPKPMASPAAAFAAQQAAPSLVSSLTTASPKDPTDEVLQSLLDDGDVLMPGMPPDLQAELMSSASSSFTGITTFGTLPQQLSTTFGNAANMLTDHYAAELLSSPKFALSEDAAMSGGLGPAATSEAAAAAAASVAAVNAAVVGSAVDAAAFNAATGGHCNPLVIKSVKILCTSQN